MVPVEAVTDPEIDVAPVIALGTPHTSVAKASSHPVFATWPPPHGNTTAVRKDYLSFRSDVALHLSSMVCHHVMSYVSRKQIARAAPRGPAAPGLRGSLPAAAAVGWPAAATVACPARRAHTRAWFPVRWSSSTRMSKMEPAASAHQRRSRLLWTTLASWWTPRFSQHSPTPCWEGKEQTNHMSKSSVLTFTSFKTRVTTFTPSMKINFVWPEWHFKDSHWIKWLASMYL